MKRPAKAQRSVLWLGAIFPAVGLIVLADQIGARVIGYGQQSVEIVSIIETGNARAPHSLIYRTADGKTDHMYWPKHEAGANDCLPGMLVEADISFSVGDAHVETCRAKPAS